MSKRIREAELTLSALTASGNGCGQLESGQDVEVPYTLPGDRAHITYASRKKKGRYQGRLIDIDTPAKERVTPRCVHAGQCGGCRLQHLDYNAQLAWKEARVRSLFQDLAEPGLFHPILACDPPWNYRNKMEFSFSNDREGRLYLGLFKGQGRVVDLEECHLVDPWYSAVLKEAREWVQAWELEAYYPPKDAGQLRTLTVREGKASGDRMILLTVSGNPNYALRKEAIADFSQRMQAFHPEGEAGLSLFLRVQQIAKGSPTRFYEMHLGGKESIREELRVKDPTGKEQCLRFDISPTAFFQPNSQQAARLYSAALAHVSLEHCQRAYDLYCGTGTLGICLAAHVDEVLSVELCAEAALDARQNASLNGLENVHVVTGDVGQVLTQRMASPDFQSPDLVLVDPPRAGLDDTALQHVLRLAAKQLIYISCNPASQAENVRALCASDYKVKAIQAVDQFPHTAHVENIVILERST
jgi:23S rRNA (uracil1939-C5)-methyltransferase